MAVGLVLEQRMLVTKAITATTALANVRVTMIWVELWLTAMPTNAQIITSYKCAFGEVTSTTALQG